MGREIALYIAAAISISGTCARAEGICDAALVKATYNLANSVGLDWRLADLISQSTYDQIKHDAGVNAVVYGVPVGANYDDFRQRIDTLKKEHNESINYSQQLNIAWSGLDPNSINPYRDCLNTQVLNAAGLHAVVTGATDRDISILLRWYVPGKQRTSIDWQGTTPQLRALFPRSLSQGDFTVIVPRPKQQMAVAGNGSGYTTQRIVLEPLPPPPPPAPDLTPRWVSFTSPNVPTLDGGGHTVGWLSGINFALYVDPKKSSSAAPFHFNYAYYNGSGTWRGSQNITVQLLDGAGHVLAALPPFGLDRGHCIYGGAQSQPQRDGNTPDNDASAIRAIGVQVDRVSGDQTGC